ncbi:MAG: YIP1 family protein [Dehalococcoidia bacterium]
MFIDPSSNLNDRTPQSRSLYEYVYEVLIRPQWVMSDISIDKPYKHATSVFLIVGVLLGVGFGFQGSLGYFVGLYGALYGGILFPFLFGTGLLIISALFYWFGTSLDGSGTYWEIALPTIFSSIPISFLVLIPLIRLFVDPLPILIYLLIIPVTLISTARLLYFALMAGHRFSGFQSVLTLASPILFLGLIFIAIFFVSVILSLISFS